jgi:hypothetical protein
VRETIFETPVDGERLGGMPPKSNSPDVLRSAMTPGECLSNLSPGTMPVNRNVVNIERPRRGYGY